MTAVLTSLHGREIGLTDEGALLVRSGVIVSPDGSPVSFPDGIDYTEFGTIPQQGIVADYTAVLADVGKHIYHSSADTNARTWTIPANDSVAFEIGQTLTFINEPGAGTIIIAINSDTMWLAGSSTTGSRTLAAGGVATAVKVKTTKWVISGAGLT